MKWISVKDRTPELHQVVLVWSSAVWLASYAQSIGQESFWNCAEYDDSCFMSDLVTHWMPLPDRPDRDESEEVSNRCSCAHFNQEGGKCPYEANYPACSEKCAVRKS
jgi:hypothetical protein